MAEMASSSPSALAQASFDARRVLWRVVVIVELYGGLVSVS
jgi:hypothetical protein